MTPEDLHQRALTNLPRERLVSEIAVAILTPLIAAVIKHYLAKKCPGKPASAAVRSPGPFARWQLRRVVRQMCSDPTVLDAAGLTAFGPDPLTIDRIYGDAARDSLLATTAKLSDTEIASLASSAST